jgi:cytochrome b subunit of formate dehydrogenase
MLIISRIALAWVGSVLLSSLFCLPIAAAAAEAPANEICLSCHGVPGLEKQKQGKKVSLAVNADEFSKSVHAPFTCTTCHTDALTVPHPADLKPVQCNTCHAETVKAYTASIHSKGRAQGFTEPPTCAGCHGDIHKLVRQSEPTSQVHPKNIAATCASCHADAEMAKKFRIPVVRPVQAYVQSVHARAVQAGKEGAVCSHCHGAHDILPGSDPASRIWRTKVPETCGQCHSGVLVTYQGSVHGEAVARGVRDAPVCTDCHGEHRILSSNEPNSPVFVDNIAGETCGRCHGSARLSEKYGLPLDKVPAFEDSFHGLALRTGLMTVANCASCHGVHGILPSSDPRSNVNEHNLPKTCGQCHPGAGTRFSLGRVHVSATDGSPAIYWIRLIYLWVIVLTIGGMVLHNLIDFLRKARAERPVFHAGATPRERMTRVLRWQHGAVMVSFLVLVYTGFALKYPEGWWAAPLLAWETELGLRRLLHRAAAVILMAALVWHLVHLSVSPELRAKLRGLMFSVKDVHDFVKLQSYNLGRTQVRPRFGKFSYIEKAEYWAFMWGMVLMSVTGLLLWFANVSLALMPKWITDVATAIHFYEAILATLAIVVWHFYWVIFDPEVYPMDASWWHGRPPVARAHERMEKTDDDMSGSRHEEVRAHRAEPQEDR